MVGGRALTEPLTFLWLELSKVRRGGGARGLLCPHPQGSGQQGVGSSPGRFWSLRSWGCGLHFCGPPLWPSPTFHAVFVFLLCFCKRLCAPDISPLSARGRFPASVV